MILLITAVDVKSKPIDVKSNSHAKYNVDSNTKDAKFMMLKCY